MACHDDSNGLWSAAEISAQAGQMFAVVVEGYDSNERGDYTLLIVKTDESGLCTSGADEDGDGVMDCDDPDCASDVACGGGASFRQGESGGVPAEFEPAALGGAR
jgi:hypothetical protein